jgi:hypothetical protein
MPVASTPAAVIRILMIMRPSPFRLGIYGDDSVVPALLNRLPNSLGVFFAVILVEV